MVKFNKSLIGGFFLVGLIGGITTVLLRFQFWYILAPMMFLLAVFGAFLYLLDHVCCVFNHKQELSYSPPAAIYFSRKLKTEGVKGIEKYKDSIFLCTTCNKCGHADLRMELRNSLVEQGVEPESLTSIRQSLSKNGNPYGSSEPRFSFLSNSTTGDSSTAFFVGCTSCYRVPELAVSASSLLEASGITFTLIPDEKCCGFSLYMLGDFKKADEIVQENMKMFKEKGIKELITLCPACYNAFKTLYSDHSDFKIQVRHLLEVLKPKSTLSNLTLTLHESCHLEDEIKRIALDSLKDCTVQKSKGSCCGAPLLSYNPEIGIEIAQKIPKRATGDYITTYCPSCYLILSRVEPEKTVDYYTLLRASSVKDIENLKEWTQNLYFQ